MHDIADFLRRHPPFDALADEALDRVAASAEIEYFAAGTLIFTQGAAPQELRVVRTGAVELLDRGRVLDLLGEGEPFGHASMLSGLPTGFAVRAHEDTLCYRWPADVALPVLARPEGLRFVARSLSARAELDPDAPASLPAGIAGIAVRRVDTLIRAEPVVCDPGVSIREAARRMTAAGASAVVVSLGAGGLGILTDHDIRSRVVAAGVPIDRPVADAMTPGAHTAAPDRLVDDVMLEMLDLGIRHVPVVSSASRVLGVVEDVDVLAADTRTPFRIRRAIAEAHTRDEVVRAAAALPSTIVTLHDAELAPSSVAAMASVIADALTRRLLDLALERAGPPPAPLAWVALGSIARREATPASDVDSALVWAGEDRDPDMRSYARGVAQDVEAGLAGCGLRIDEHGATASSPLFSRSLGAWQAAIRGWIAEPEGDKALILASVLADGRRVWGSAAGARLTEPFRAGGDRTMLLRLLARFSLAHRPPTGFLRDIVVEHSGERRGRFDIKRGGLLPIVGLARYAAATAGSAALGTRERLRAAAGAGTLDAEQARTLEEAFDLVLGLRLEHQVEQLRRGERPDDHIDPRDLNPLTRRYLKEAFRAVASVQRGIDRELGFGVR